MNEENTITLDIFQHFFHTNLDFSSQNFVRNKISSQQTLVGVGGGGLHKNRFNFAAILEKGADPRMLISGALAETCALLRLLVFLIH